ncbi:MAG: FtsX-like permease family protein [Clostridia bacterium]|nr:FtsX-like permease family protein [Clostridia bacterium]
MQRVAIARALVNNPEILLADEPTGALDTTTSVQIMELIREIAGERLVIMVTHNPELAEQYSSRIVRLQDGQVISDSNPYEGDEAAEIEKIRSIETVEILTEAERKAVEKQRKREEKELRQKSSMSFKTSLGLSARNLLTKKGRTILTSVAGSIGIISVCLVLALSNGFNGYIKRTQEAMLASSPIEITETTLDTGAIIAGMTAANDIPDLSQIGDKVYVNSFLTGIAQNMTVNNNLSDTYLRYLDEEMDKSLYRAIVYDTGMQLNNSLYTNVEIQNSEGVTEQTVMSLSRLKEYYTYKLTQQEEKYASLAPLVEYLGSIYGKMPGTTDVTAAGYGEYVLSQYDVIGENAHFPTKSSEAVLVIGSNNDMTDLTLAQLGFIGEEEFLSLFPQGDETMDDIEEVMIPFEKVIGKKFMLNYNDAIYTESTEGNYIYKYKDERDGLSLGENTGIEITISGVLRLKDGINQGCLSSGLYFTEQLYREYQAANLNSKLATTLKTQTQKVSEYNAWVKLLMEMDPKADPLAYMGKVQEFKTFCDDNASYFKPAAKTVEKYYISGAANNQTSNGESENGSGEGEGGDSANNPLFSNMKDAWFLYGDMALREIGGKDKVNAISIYTDSFEAKEGVLAHLDAWNESCEANDVVKYSDMIGDMMSMVETMLNAITYVLVAFTAISLVVSSVMIGIITYVSVVERTKEIGVLRSLGARKKDIKNLFNAETFIIGLASGVFGVAVTYLLSLGVNAILGVLTGISTLASLPFGSALIMIVISITLTLISGLIPAGAAARKDPVIALRTE